MTRVERPQLGHEVLPTAGDVRKVPRRSKRHFHRLFHPGVCLQAGGLQVQGDYKENPTFLAPNTTIQSVMNTKLKSAKGLFTARPTPFLTELRHSTLMGELCKVLFGL